MPATRSQGTVSRVSTPNSPQPLDTLTFSSDVEGPIIPAKSNRQSKPQRRQRSLNPVEPEEIIEISDDDDDEPPRRQDSQTSMIADFRRQINKLREVCGISVQFNGWRSLTRFWWLFVFRKVSSIRKITNELFESSTTFAKKINNCKPFESPVL